MSFIKSGWLSIGYWWARIAIPAIIATFVLFIFTVALSAVSVFEAAVALAAAAPSGGGSVAAALISLLAELPAIVIAFCVVVAVIWLFLLSVFLLFLLFIVDNAVNFIGNLISQPGTALGGLWKDIKAGAGNVAKGIADGAQEVTSEFQKNIPKVIGPVIRLTRWVKSLFD